MRAVMATSGTLRPAAPDERRARWVGRARLRTLIVGMAPALLIVVAGIIVYRNSFAGPFIFDDEISLFYNPSITHPATWWAAFMPAGGGRTTQSRPLLNASFALNYALGKKDPWGYHLVNLAVHLLCGLTLFGAVRGTLRLPSVPAWLGCRATGLALATALLWVLHPLQTAAVTYISQRAESLAALFYLLTFYAFVRGVPARRPWPWYTAAVLTCGLGMATKETVGTAPALLLLFDAIFVGLSFREALHRRWGLYTGVAATYGIFAAVVASSHGRGGSAGLGLGVSSVDYARTQCVAVIRYLRLAFWPDDLTLDYGTRLFVQPAEYLPHAMVICGLAALTAVVLIRWPKAGFPAAWFFVTLTPSSSVVPVVTQTMAEHRMYLPLVGLLGGVVVGVYAAWQAFMTRGWPAAEPALRRWVVPAVALAAAAVALGAVTVQRNDVYRSGITIWQDTVRKRPENARAWCSLGQQYYQAGRLPEAVEHYNEAIKLNPRYAEAYLNRAISLDALHRDEPAMADFNTAIDLDPGAAFAYQLRGNAWFGRRQYDRAIADYTRTISLAPDIAATSYYNRGNSYQAQGQFDLAVEDFTRAVELQPDYCEAYNNRAAIYCVQMNRCDLAWADAEACRRTGGQVHPALLKLLQERTGRSAPAPADG